ncbi:MAG TPA: hypothetical protein ENK43_05935 [Planctomycetes bacterium]|nr:hypothetical protein [Planctomycetota bacterium]
MTVIHATNPEPLTLFTKAELATIYDREEILRERELGNPPRGRVDDWIAKVLPARSDLEVRPAPHGMVEVTQSAYRPFYKKELYALGEAVEPIPDPSPTAAPPSPPPVNEVLAALLSLEGTRYLYGGSAPSGSDIHAEALIARGLMRREDLADPDLGMIMRSAGIDCSGLFNLSTRYAFFGDSRHVYEAFGASTRHLEGLAATEPEAMSKALEPLDLIVYRGHVIVALGDGRVIQAVGDGTNARTFALETGFDGPPDEKYDRVVIDDAEPILRALVHRQGRTFSADWRFDDAHFMIVAYEGLAATR